MCSEVCEPEAWESLFNKPNLTKFYSPSIKGVDFPSVFIEKAFHDDRKGKLHISISDGDKTKTNRKTNIEVFNLPDAKEITVLCDGKKFNEYKILDNSRISINTQVRKHSFEIDTGYYLSEQEEQVFNKKLKETKSEDIPYSNHSSGPTSRLVLPSSLNKCSCC